MVSAVLLTAWASVAEAAEPDAATVIAALEVEALALLERAGGASARAGSGLIDRAVELGKRAAKPELIAAEPERVTQVLEQVCRAAFERGVAGPYASGPSVEDRRAPASSETWRDYRRGNAELQGVFDDVSARFEAQGRQGSAAAMKLCALQFQRPLYKDARQGFISECRVSPPSPDLVRDVERFAGVFARELEATRARQRVLARVLGATAPAMVALAEGMAEREAIAACFEQVGEGRAECLFSAFPERFAAPLPCPNDGSGTGNYGRGRAEGGAVFRALAVDPSRASVGISDDPALVDAAAYLDREFGLGGHLGISLIWFDGLSSLRAGDLERARAKLVDEDLQALDSTSRSQLLLARGRAYYAAGHLREALADATLAREAGAGLNAEFDRARALRALGRLHEAEASLRGRFEAGDAASPVLAFTERARISSGLPGWPNGLHECEPNQERVTTSRAVVGRSVDRCMKEWDSASCDGLRELERAFGRIEAAQDGDPTACALIGKALEEVPITSEREALCLEYGTVQFELGRLDEAAKTWSSCEEHPQAKINLAAVAVERGELDRAEDGLEKVLATLEKLGSAQPARVQADANLAMIEMQRGEFDAAKRRLEAALPLAQALDDPELVAWFHDNIGTASELGGDRAAGAVAFEAAIASRRARDPRHPGLVNSYANLATLRWAEGDVANATALFSEMQAVENEQLGRVIRYGSEDQRRAALALMWNATDWLISFDLDQGSKESRALAFRSVMMRQGRALDAYARSRREQTTAASPELAAARDAVRMANEQIVARALGGGTGVIAELLAEAERAQRALAAVEGRTASTVLDVVPSLTEVQAALGPDQALLNFVQVRRFDPAATRERFGPDRYVVYVVTATRAEVVDLGPADALDRALGEWLAALRRPDRDLTPAHAVSERVLAPIFAVTDGATDWRVVPDGVFNLVPLAGLPVADGLLIDHHRISHLTNARELMVEPRSGPADGEVVVVADPAFGGTASEPSDAGLLAGVRFGALPGTRREAEGLVTVLDEVRVLAGTDATRDALLAVHQPEILHIATHGFFVPGATSTVERGVSADSRGLTLQLGPAPEPPAVPALARAGLALAGANTDRTSGILTGLDLLGLDLVGTRLVTLSACETGVGEVASRDGIYGLRRALHLAGAESRVVSLWQVDDASTAELMVLMYARLREGASRAEALRAAQREIASRPETAHPYFWAAFVLDGSPATLDGRSPEPMPAWRHPAWSGPDGPPELRRRGCATTEPTGLAPLLGLALIAGLVRHRRTRHRRAHARG